MKSLFFVALGVCGMVGSYGALGQSVEAVQPPTIELVGTNCVDLGSIPNYEYQLIKFEFRNPGNSPVEIRKVLSTCPCIRGYPQTAVIQPKGSAVITVELNATVIAGQFVRKVFVDTNDKKHPQIGLSVTGEVRPLFTGFPSAPYVFRVKDIHEAETNRFTVTATETNLFFGATTVSCSNNLLQAVALVSTNLTEKTNASYNITLVLTSRDAGRQTTFLDFPTQGQGRTNLPPFRLAIQGRIGTELSLSPSQVLVTDPGEGNSLLRHLRIRVGEPTVNPEALTWAPQREGVSITVKEAPKPKFTSPKKEKGTDAKREAYVAKSFGAKASASAEKEASSGLLLTLTINAKAAAQILAEKDPSLTFSYPKYKSTVLRFVSTLPEEKELDAEEKEPEAPAEEK